MPRKSKHGQDDKGRRVGVATSEPPSQSSHFKAYRRENESVERGVRGRHGSQRGLVTESTQTDYSLCVCVRERERRPR